MADEASLAAAVAVAAEADAVGLDVEWRPGRERCPQPPASLLQVARPLAFCRVEVQASLLRVARADSAWLCSVGCTP